MGVEFDFGKNSGDASGEGCPVNGLNATELYTQKGLKW